MYEDKKLLFLSSSSIFSLKQAKLIICKLFFTHKSIHTHIDFLLFLNSLKKKNVVLHKTPWLAFSLLNKD